MGLDRTTDAIAHFIGFFDLKVDALRQRELHDAFNMKRADPDLGQIGTVTVDIPAKYKLIQDDTKPTTHTSPAVSPPILWPPAPSLPDLAQPMPPAPRPEDPEREDDPLAPLAELSWSFTLPPPVPMLPGSMITITVQTAYLSDIDLLGTGHFRDPAESIADLGKLAVAARLLHAPEGFGPAEIPDLEAIDALAEAMAGFSVGQSFGFEVNTLHGDEAPAKLMNGVEVEALPGWNDLLPLHHRPEEEDEEAQDDTLLAEWALPEAYTPNEDGPEGHSLVTGGNLLINEAHVSVSLVDAPLIAVGGAWRDIDVVSQVSAVTNHDAGPGATAAPSSIYQTVEIETEANPAFWQEGRDMAGAGPDTVILSVISGDLIISNYIEQIIEVMDNDMFGMAIGGANTAYILGDNTVFNATNLFTGGMAYDLILIGGDYLTVDTIHQTQILLDDDVIDAALPAAGAPAAQAVEEDAAQAHSGLAKSAESTSFPLDEDDAEEDAEEEGAEPETAWDPAPDNLLMSEAKLMTIGEDTRAEMSATLADMLASGTDDMEALKQSLMNDPALAGLEQARVLKIEGSLIQMNTLKQTILASDRDDIRIDGGTPGDLELVAGANALLNAATLQARGVDSVVMTKEEGYSDLLIHQARLIDEPELMEVSGAELANEAVAFLMEETQDGISQKMSDTFATAKADIMAENFDPMAGAFV